MKHIAYVAKGLMAAGAAFLTAIVTYNLDVSPVILVAVVTVLAFVAVYAIPNGAKPE